MPNRKDARSSHEVRNITLTRNYLTHAEGSCLVELGMTKIITSASVTDKAPKWLSGSSRGWVTAEYGMLPRATQTRNRRPVTALKQSGRSMEIQRLIGRALRAVTRLDILGERTITVDCDVIDADGGTRVAAIIGAAVSLYDVGTRLVEEGITEQHIMRELVAAISVGVLEENVLVDLCYEEDSTADVDMNIVMTESGNLVEIQGTAERNTFNRTMLSAMLDSAESAIQKIIAVQKENLGLK
ncbi:MAG: ribonuclease PH [Candidatus Latescibacteria bacterium]|jgi:ribonuclease PH|nr:ribonuclease PH [Candidatus Latescibacterota bacterium]